MYKGSVDFAAEIKGNGLIFAPVIFMPNKPGVDRVEIKGLDGCLIRTTVHLTTVQSRAAGISLAEEVNTAALNRIAFFENIVIENARVQKDDFFYLAAKPGERVLVAGPGQIAVKGGAAKFVLTRSPYTIKSAVEKASTCRGEHYYGLFRAARLSMGSIEEFLHLYHILLVVYKDQQSKVDAFFRAEDAAVPQSQSPKATGVMETIYTRLRNEFAHERAGVDLNETKKEMANRLAELRILTRRAIELNL